MLVAWNKYNKNMYALVKIWFMGHKQTVQNLIKLHIMRHLIKIVTVYLHYALLSFGNK